MLLPPATKLGQGYVFTAVCDSVHRGEYLTRYTLPGPGTPSPPDQVHPTDQVHPPPRPGTPRDQVQPPDQVYPPGPGTPSRDQVHPPGPGTPPWDQVHPPEPGTPPGAQHAGRYGLRAGGTHPTGMQSCFWSIFTSISFTSRFLFKTNIEC